LSSGGRGGPELRFAVKSFPTALWTIISLIGFAISLVWLDRLEQREKRLARVVVEQPEDLAVPIAQ
jgi:hypothetical protein